MIVLHPSDPVLVVAVTVSLGFLLLLFSLLVPEEATIQLSSLLPKMPPLVNLEATAQAEESSPTPLAPFAQAVHQAIIAQEHTEDEKPGSPPEVQSPAVASPLFTPPPAAPIGSPLFHWPSAEPSAPSGQAWLEAQQTRPERREPQPDQRFQPTIVPSRLASAETSPERGRRITWTSLVDESAQELDLPTRLKIIEALGLVGGSWSREILARAYEQEMEAQVRGAIFLALRDSKSAA